MSLLTQTCLKNQNRILQMERSFRTFLLIKILLIFPAYTTTFPFVVIPQTNSKNRSCTPFCVALGHILETQDAVFRNLLRKIYGTRTRFLSQNSPTGCIGAHVIHWYVTTFRLAQDHLSVQGERV